MLHTKVALSGERHYNFLSTAFRSPIWNRLVSWISGVC